MPIIPCLTNICRLIHKKYINTFKLAHTAKSSAAYISWSHFQKQETLKMSSHHHNDNKSCLSPHQSPGLLSSPLIHEVRSPGISTRISALIRGRNSTSNREMARKMNDWTPASQSKITKKRFVDPKYKGIGWDDHRRTNRRESSSPHGSGWYAGWKHSTDGAFLETNLSWYSKEWVFYLFTCCCCCCCYCYCYARGRVLASLMQAGT